MTTVVLPLLIFQLTRSALNLSLTVAATVLPYLLFGLLVGAWVDRVNRRRVMIFTDLGRTLAIASIPVAAALGPLSVWWIYAVAFLSSTLTICFDAANFAAVPSLVSAEDLVRAHGRIQASYAIARVAGPFCAGVLLAVLTLPQLLWIDAASFLVSVLSLLLVRVSFNTRLQEAATPAQPTTIWRDIGEGLGYVLGHPVLRTITVLLLLINFILPTASAQLVLFATEVLGVGDAQIGFLYAFASGGAVLAALVAPRLSKHLPLGQLALAGVGVEGLAILVAAQLHIYGAVLLLWAMRSGADVLFAVSSYSLVQRLVPSPLLGRTITVLRVLSWPTASLGAILGGWAILQSANPILVYSFIGAAAGSIGLLFWWTPVGQGERSAGEGL
ncbi:MAG TPA: MFS transporter [Ktedonobacterales bacterium]|nr:MFS transporter [Ktedonobacterales bacterium]